MMASTFELVDSMRPMPLSPQEFYENATKTADAEGRMPLSRLTAWNIFPFEPEGLRVVPLRTPEVPESSRRGEEGAGPCGNCDGTLGGVVWHERTGDSSNSVSPLAHRSS